MRITATRGIACAGIWISAAVRIAFTRIRVVAAIVALVVHADFAIDTACIPAFILHAAAFAALGIGIVARALAAFLITAIGHTSVIYAMLAGFHIAALVATEARTGVRIPVAARRLAAAAAFRLTALFLALARFRVAAGGLAAAALTVATGFIRVAASPIAAGLAILAAFHTAIVFQVIIIIAALQIRIIADSFATLVAFLANRYTVGSIAHSAFFRLTAYLTALAIQTSIFFVATLRLRIVTIRIRATIQPFPAFAGSSALRCGHCNRECLCNLIIRRRYILFLARACAWSFRYLIVFRERYELVCSFLGQIRGATLAKSPCSIGRPANLIIARRNFDYPFAIAPCTWRLIWINGIIGS